MMVHFGDIGQRITESGQNGVGVFAKPRSDPFPRAELEEQTTLKRCRQ